MKISAEFDWHKTGSEIWDIAIVTDEGEALLSEGGARSVVNGDEIHAGPDQEYPELYVRFAEFIANNEIEVDLSPMRHVADVFTLGRRIEVEPFDW